MAPRSTLSSSFGPVCSRRLIAAACIRTRQGRAACACMAVPARQAKSVSQSNFDIKQAGGLAAVAATALGAVAYSRFSMDPEWLHSNAARALGLSTLAGLSTSIGAIAAVVRKPNDATLAFLLGLALGVMLTLSVLEMWLNNAREHGWLLITVFTGVGAGLYFVLQPYFPEFELPDHDEEGPADAEEQASGTASLRDSTTKRTAHRTSMSGQPPASPTQQAQLPPAGAALSSGNGHSGNAPVAASGALEAAETSGRTSVAPSELFRLGLLMAFTMTLHNLPEGLAVAFSSYTDFGEVMALAIAMHNIPEGIIVAAPIYAATGSRVQALGVATLSGLSEPLGALAAILFVKPFLTETRLQCALAVTGGIMLAVCILELWPEAKKCKRDVRAWQGIAVGSLVMLVTLATDV